jgi:phage shock protein A
MELMGAFMGLLFTLLWIWVIVAGFRAVGRRILGVLTGDWSGRRGQPFAVNPAYFGRPPVLEQQPQELVAVPRDLWSPEERRHFGRRLGQAPAVSTDAVVSEMQRELGKLVRNAGEVEANLFRWRGELHRIEAAQADWTEKAALAVDRGRDALARSALAEKAKLEPRVTGLNADIARLDSLLAGYRRDIAALEGKLSESIRRQVLAESRLQGAEGSVRARELVFGQRTAAALSDLDRVERAADLAEGQAEALTLGGDPGLAGEFAALEQQDKLDRELDALKKKRRRPAA